MAIFSFLQHTHSTVLALVKATSKSLSRMPPKKRKSSGTGKPTAKRTKKAADASEVKTSSLAIRKAKGTSNGTAIQIQDSSDTELLVARFDPEAHANRASSYRYYTSGNGNNSASPVQQNLSKIFDTYRGSPAPKPFLRPLTPADSPSTSPDKINITGAQKYLNDLSIELDEVVHLALCDLLSCPSIGEFDREAFISGWLSASTTNPNSKPLETISRQKSHVESLRTRLTADPTYFKTIYRSAFKLAKPESQRSVPLDSALEFWRMFFSSAAGGIEWSTKSTPWLDLWLEYYENQGKRPVNKDLWNMVGELVVKTKEPDGETLEWWNEDGAWPMAVDEFVGWVKEKRKSGELAAVGGEEMDTS